MRTHRLAPFFVNFGFRMQLVSEPFPDAGHWSCRNVIRSDRGYQQRKGKRWEDSSFRRRLSFVLAHGRKGDNGMVGGPPTKPMREQSCPQLIQIPMSDDLKCCDTPFRRD